MDKSLDNIKELPIKDIYDLVQDGEIDPLKAILVLKEIEKKAKQYKTMIEDIAIDEISKYDREGAYIDGYNIKLKRSAGRWDFKDIPEIVELENKLKLLKDKHKSAYKQLDNNITSVGEGGEVITPAVFKPGKDIITINKKI